MRHFESWVAFQYSQVVFSGEFVFFEAGVVVTQENAAFEEIRCKLHGALVKRFDILVFIDRRERLGQPDP